MSRRRALTIPTAEVETDLDLAPLLSIMVKLIPVLLLSSAFVHVSYIATDLPEKTQAQNVKPPLDIPLADIEVQVDYKNGFTILVQGNKNEVQRIPTLSNRQLDYKKLNEILALIKEQHPQVFHLTLSPGAEISYQDVIKTMDTSRRPYDKNLQFRYLDPKSQTWETTAFMFPDVSLNEAEGG